VGPYFASRRSFRLARFILVFLAVPARFGYSDSPYADALSESRRWTAAAFEGTTLELKTAVGLNVLANHGPVFANRQAGLPLKLDNTVFARGIYCHAPSKLLVRLPSAGERFSARVGVTSNGMTRPGRGSIVCGVTVGGQDAFRSGVLSEGMASVPVQVDLRGASEFFLEVEPTADGISCDQAAWVDASITLADGKTVGLGDLRIARVDRRPFPKRPPFSFRYGDRPSSELLAEWPVTRETRRLDAQRSERIVTYRDPQAGLVVNCRGIEYDDYPTIEWAVTFENTGTSETPILSDVRTLDVRFERDVDGEFALHHLRGDDCTPASYEPLETPLGARSEFVFAPSGGRPTQGAFPYFNIAWPREGVIAAVGWPGQWMARFTRDEGVGLRIEAGQELLRLKLRPGERVRGPLAVLQFWTGDRVDAQNVWRRWMLAHNLPRPGGALRPILSSCSGGFMPGLRCDEAGERRFIDAFAKEGVRLDYWWMDAGWYPCGDGWPRVGTWEPDTERFPRGLRAVSDHVHQMGSKLIVWFEPERVVAGTWLAQNHPEWIHGGADGGLLDLGNADARAWLIEHVDRLLTEHGIDLYRQDFNVDPLPYWRAADPPDRQGITELRHVEGYLAYWDELRRRHPDLLIDSCASGGRRNDLETLRRAVPLLRSDYQSFQGDPSFALGNQCHTYGLSSWFPFYGQGVYFNEQDLTYNVRSHFCPALGLAADVRRPDIDWESLRRLSGEWKTISEFLLGDFYPLTPYSLDPEAWLAWQFDRPETGEGVVQVFRRGESIHESARLRPRGIARDATYSITDLDQSDTTRVAGHELLDKGLLVTVPQPIAAKILVYRRVTP